MPENNFEKIGVDVVMEGLDRFTKDFKTYAKELKDGTKETEKFQKETEKTKKSGNVFSKTIDSMKSAVKGFIGNMTAGIPIIGAFGGAIATALGPIGLAITAIVGMGVAITKLGQRGGQIEAVRLAFANIISPVLTADESIQGFVDNLRMAAGGAISEFELLKQANTALAGATGEVRDTFARALPDLLQTAQVQAAATGQSVEHLFSSLVTGIKRSSPLLIDNTGLVISITDAQEAYAESLGITASALTEEQKQIALINATVEAGAEAQRLAGGIQVNAATEAAKAQALLKDTVDQLALAFEPLGGLILQGVNALLSFVNTIVREVAPYIQFFGQTLSNVFNGANRVLETFGMSSHQVSESTKGSMGTMAKETKGFVQQFIDLIGQGADFLIQGAQNYARGAANIMAAFGNAFLAGANRFVFPVIINIAQFIADFLTGFSPAKMGPLSNIDTGAGNIMKSWAEGFVGAFQPQRIQDVASDVDRILGGIGQQGIEAVESRLKMLDQQLRPFQEQLKIVKDRFEAIQAPAQAAISAIDRQLEQATLALAKGEAGSADVVRQLNIQKEALSQQLDLEQQRVDQATVQLALAQSRQQSERTALEIQKARLSGSTKEVEAFKKIAKEAKTASDKVKTASGKGVAPLASTGAGAGVNLPDRSSEISDFASGGGLENPFAGLLQFGNELGEDFLSGLGAGGELDAFQTNLGLLGDATDQIANSDPVQGLVGMFSGLGEGLADAAETAIDSFVGFFTDPQQEGGLAHFINRVNTEGFAAVFGDMTLSIAQWGLNVLQPAADAAVELMMSPFLSPADPNSLYSRFQRMSNDFDTFVGSVGEAIGEGISTWVDSHIIQPIRDIIDPYFDIASEDGFLIAFANLGVDIIAATGDLLSPINAIFQPFRDWIDGTTEGGGLPAMRDDLLQIFLDLPMAIFNALQNIGAIFVAVLFAPLQGIIDGVVEVFNNFLSTVTDNAFVNFFRTQFPNVFGGLPQGVGLEAPQIPTPNYTPVFPTAQARGGITSGAGAVRVGERGAEDIMLMKGASMATFNNRFVTAMDSLSSAIMSGALGVATPATQQTNNSSVSNNLTLNANMQGGTRPADILNQVALSKVFN